MKTISISWAAALLFLVAAWGWTQGGTIGPRDGLDLPPTDLDRVTVGSEAPDFTLETRQGSRITLSDFRGKKNLVVVFYRGHW
jgi:cytochrome oxidase Cu insertion factor (SCO1/SenC/PrrC family)